MLLFHFLWGMCYLQGGVLLSLENTLYMISVSMSLRCSLKLSKTWTLIWHNNTFTTWFVASICCKTYCHETSQNISVPSGNQLSDYGFSFNRNKCDFVEKILQIMYQTYIILIYHFQNIKKENLNSICKDLLSICKCQQLLSNNFFT